MEATSSSDLDVFLEDLEPLVTESLTWRGGQIELEVSVYLTGRIPPDILTSSGRCIVLSSDHVLLMTSPGGDHMLPGGRRLSGEDIRSATIREVAEETSLLITDPNELAVILYRHITPKPDIYPYPYPIFVNVVYVQNLPAPQNPVVNDTYELAGEFVPFSTARSRVPLHQQRLLDSLTIHRT